MSNVIPLKPTANASAAATAEKKRHASDPEALVLQADRIAAAIAKRPLLHSAKERLRLAENLWDLLEAAVRKAPTLTKALILQKAGQGQPHESTKRLGYFAIDPALPIDTRDKRSQDLRKHVAKYAHIAKMGADLSGLDPNEAIIMLVRGTGYERQAPDAKSEPFDSALVDIQTAIQRLTESVTASHDIETYFALLRRHKLTLRQMSDAKNASQISLEFVSQAGAWTTAYLKHQARHFISDEVARCVPRVSIGRGHLATVDGQLQLHTVPGVRASFRAYSDGSYEEIPKDQLIKLRASVDVSIDVSLAVCAFDEPQRALPVLLIRPAIRIRVYEKTPSVYLSRGDGEEDEDWAFFNSHDDHDDAHAESTVFSSDRGARCTLLGSEGHDVMEKGLVDRAYYSIDDSSSLGDFLELEQPKGTDWLVEPLTLSAQRKWLLRQMRTSDDTPADIALPDWLDSGVSPEHFWKWFIARMAFSPKDAGVDGGLQVMLESGLTSKDLGKLFQQWFGDDDSWEKWTADFSPEDRARFRIRREAMLEAASQWKDTIGPWREASYFAPVSCPEGTLAAALERGVFEAPSLHGPLEVIRREFIVLNDLLERDIEKVSKRRKDFLGEMAAKDPRGITKT
jgi:hypothetical protein